jgi:hypothetical protein
MSFMQPYEKDLTNLIVAQPEDVCKYFTLVSFTLFFSFWMILIVSSSFYQEISNITWPSRDCRHRNARDDLTGSRYYKK